MGFIIGKYQKACKALSLHAGKHGKIRLHGAGRFKQAVKPNDSGPQHNRLVVCL